MLDLTTDTDLDLVLLPHITTMLLIGQVMRHLFGWLGPRRWPELGAPPRRPERRPSGYRFTFCSAAGYRQFRRRIYKDAPAGSF